MLWFIATILFCPQLRIESMEISNQVKVIIPRQGLVEGLVENPEKLVEGLVETPERLVEGLVETPREVMKRLVEKAEGLGEKLAGTKIKILQLMSEDSTITIIEMAQRLSVSTTTIDKHIQQMKNKYIKRIGGDKGGRWVLDPD